MSSPNAGLVMLTQPLSPLAEAYRVLRTNLLYARDDSRPRSLVVAGIGHERASLVVANLAVATAQAGVSTILIDAHLRQPQQHTLFGLANDKGLATALTSDAPPAPLPTSVPNLMLLPAGPTPAIPAELLGTARLEAVLSHLTATADLVLLDAPPIGELADTPVLATKVAGVLLVIHAGRTRRARALEVRDVLERIGANVVGVALIEGSR
jgi:non-specific protein-tyrosine kinase